MKKNIAYEMAKSVYNHYEAVKEGKFHIWAVKTIDEGIEILTGVKAGKKKKHTKCQISRSLFLNKAEHLKPDANNQ